MVGAPFILYIHPALMECVNVGDSVAAFARLRVWLFRGLLGTGTLIVGAFIFGDKVALLFGIGGADGFVVASLAGGAAFWQLALLAHKWLEVEGRTLEMMWALMACTLVQILVMVIAIDLFSERGAALGMALGPTTYMIYCLTRGRRISAKVEV